MKHNNISVSVDSYKHVAIATIRRDGDGVVVAKLARQNGEMAQAAADAVVAELEKPELPELPETPEIGDLLEEGAVWSHDGTASLIYRISVVGGLPLGEYSSDAEAFYPRIRVEVSVSATETPIGKNLGAIPLFGFGGAVFSKGGIFILGEETESSSKDFVNEVLVDALRDALAAVRQIRADILSSETRIAEIQEEGCRRLRGLARKSSASA